MGFALSDAVYQPHPHPLSEQVSYGKKVIIIHVHSETWSAKKKKKKKKILQC